MDNNETTTKKKKDKAPPKIYPAPIENIKDINFPYIMEYVKDKGETDIQWLIDLMKKEVPNDKNDKPRNISFIEIRKDFVLKYMPDLMPEPKPKEPTMQARIKELEALLSDKSGKGGKK